ncbi:MAG: hypothetical protein ACYCPT_01940 [Acidimicrobiales bacterium]
MTEAVGHVPCPLCKDIAFRRRDCKACFGAGHVAVDRAIEISLATSDTERELRAVHDEWDTGRKT